MSYLGNFGPYITALIYKLINSSLEYLDTQHSVLNKNYENKFLLHIFPINFQIFLLSGLQNSVCS